MSVVSLLVLAGAWVSARRFQQRTMPPPIDVSRNEPIRYVGSRQTDKRYHHGGLRSAVGVHRYQAFRANREHAPEAGTTAGWTYSHQPYLSQWNGKFYLQYLSNEKAEYLPPARTMIVTSEDGRRWTRPQVVFPEYSLPAFTFKDPATGRSRNLDAGAKAVMHHRAGFYVTRDRRLLTFGFYSLCPSARCRNRQGLGRVVREIHADGTFGPIYVIRYNGHEGWNERNTRYPFYRDSPDKDFVKACEEVLQNKLVTLQWEEDRATDESYMFRPKDVEPRAFSFYRRSDGVIVGLWKDQLTALSRDDGRTWTDLVRARTLTTSGSKVWGQRTEDGRYALVYNHSATSRNRFPLVVMTGEDGHSFDDMLVLEAEVPPMRYSGWAKNRGPQYVRGILEGNGDPSGNYMWNTYSVNKEDIWVSRTSVPITGVVSEHVAETFDGLETEADLALWNLYVPEWAPTEVVSAAGTKGRVLQLRDHDPYDYALAERAFPPSARGTVEFRVFLKSTGKDILEFELLNERSERALRLRFDSAHAGLTFDLGGVEPEPVPFAAGEWHQLKLVFDARNGWYEAWVDGEKVKERIELTIKGETLERMVFRTGSWRGDVRLLFLDGEPAAPGLDAEDLPAAGEKVPESVFWIDDVKTTGK
jgi:BNR repeat-like domain